MPRAKRDTNSRKSRNWGAVSGVSLLTIPSGVTIDKSNYMETVAGYATFYGVAGKTFTAGITVCAGTSVDRANLGLSTIDYVTAQPCFNADSVTGCAISITKPSGSAWSSGVTHVCFYTYQTGSATPGTAFGTNVSIQYFAIGDL